jgi:hypothetical protein
LIGCRPFLTELVQICPCTLRILFLKKTKTNENKIRGQVTIFFCVEAVAVPTN